MLPFGRVAILRRPALRRRGAALAIAAAALGAALFASGPVRAEQNAPLSVAVDKARILRLDHDASLVMVANPDIADVSVESPRLLFILGRAPGETNLYVLNGRGREILNTALVVVPNDEREVTVNRNLDEGTLSCDPRCAPVPTPRSDDIAAASPFGADGAAGTTQGVVSDAGAKPSQDKPASGFAAPPGGVPPSPDDEAINPEDRAAFSGN